MAGKRHERLAGWSVVVMLFAACQTEEHLPATPEPLHPPVATLLSLEDEQVLYPGDFPWTFEGQLGDSDSSLSSLIGWWTLRQDDTILYDAATLPDNSGKVSLHINYLQEANYQLALSVTDGDGLTSSMEASFTIFNHLPVVTVLSPTVLAVDQYQPLSIALQIADADNPPGRGYRVTLVSSPDGFTSETTVGADGLVTLEYTPTTAGLVDVMFVASDELAGEGMARLTFTVRECLDVDQDMFRTCPVGERAADCDDLDASVYPGAAEACNASDDDCDGLVPDLELDLDADGKAPCEGDCIDDDAFSYPGARELCDGLDNSCDGVVPSNENDSDGDGYRGCGTSSSAADCNDSAFSIHPDALELCNGVDDDCSGGLDDKEADLDQDGWMACAGDCDDLHVYTYPGAPERLDLLDNNCDGALEGVVSLAMAQGRLEGEQTEAQAGSVLASGSDVNDDGLHDLLVGVPRYDVPSSSGVYEGIVYLVMGREDFGPFSSFRLGDGVRLEGADASANLGAALAMPGDLNSDRIDDFLVGAPLRTVGNLTSAGSVYVVAGRESFVSSPLSSIALSVIEGSSSSMNLGFALAGGGDINGDGSRDALLGAPWSTRRPQATGLVAVLSARSFGWTSRTALSTLPRVNGEGNACIGVTLAVADATNDAMSDLIIAGYGDPSSQEGVIYWTPGNSGLRGAAQLSTSELESRYYEGLSSGDRIGSSLAGGVDVDGDGLEDWLAGRIKRVGDDEALAYLMLGSATPPISSLLEDTASVRFMPSPVDECPCAVVGLGDWNHDGLDDFAISAARASSVGSSNGRVYLFLGREGASAWPSTVRLDEADGILEGERSGDQAGYAMTRGDLNGDGAMDLIVGAPYATATPGGSSLTRAGRIYVVLGVR